MSLISKQTAKLCARVDLSRLRRRPSDKLAFVDARLSAGGPLLLDTGAYIHQLKAKTPPALDALVGLRLVNHSLVAIQEMLHAIGLLDPADPRTKKNVAAIRNVLDAIPAHRSFSPPQDVLVDAAVYAGVLCRLQDYGRDRRMKALHDCTLFFHARQLGCTLVTANVADFDILQQLRPEVRVLFYKAV